MAKIVDYYESKVTILEIIDFLEGIHKLRDGQIGTVSGTIPLSDLLSYAGVTYVALSDSGAVVGVVFSGHPMPYAVEDGEIKRGVPIIYANAQNIFTGRRLIQAVREKFPKYPVMYGTTTKCNLHQSFLKGVKMADITFSIVLESLL